MNSYHDGDVYPVDVGNPNSPSPPPTGAMAKILYHLSNPALYLSDNLYHSQYDPNSLQYMLEFFRNVAQTIPASNAINPSTNHKALQQFMEGEWDEEITVRTSATSVPQTFTINCSNKMTMGGRYIEGTHQGVGAGLRIEAKSVVAFDNAGSRFQVTTWNNISTAMVFLQGGWLDSAKTINLTGETTNPVDGKMIKVRHLITIVSKDEYLIEHFETLADLPEAKRVQYRCRRTKST
ncbi:MAG: DUF1579 domain-containing protein [Sphingobacteriales bacterium]|nr:MAG: DUF1579 domain-containing protein [Sphingobacteriales bacterium]